MTLETLGFRLLLLITAVLDRFRRVKYYTSYFHLQYIFHFKNPFTFQDELLFKNKIFYYIMLYCSFFKGEWEPTPTLLKKKKRIYI